jgi:adenine-specific DNA methylase
MSILTVPPIEPSSLAGAQALIESVFPAQKVSFEAQRERKAGAGQTLTALGSYWKGRKPLILVRAIVLGCLLPPTGDPRADLELFEALLAFDEEGLARRALAANAFSAKEIAARIRLDAPRRFFKAKALDALVTDDDIERMTFPLDADRSGISLTWRRDVAEEDRLELYRRALASLSSYEERAARCKRPEEVDQEWLYARVWPKVNERYAHLGVRATSFPELVRQLGTLRYGHPPCVGDTFCGGGSVPFEAARLGCDVYASDLNPIACMLTWGALNIVGAPPERRAEIERAQREVAEAVDAEIVRLGIEHDEEGNRAKAYLYCLETRCPETGWTIPMAPGWTISKTRGVIAELVPDRANRRFDIALRTGVSEARMRAAEKGTVQGGDLVYELDGRTYRTAIKTLRGDCRLADGSNGNLLRLWEKSDFMPRSGDIFQERLYAIQWIRKETLGKPRQETFFAAPTEADLGRERTVERLVAENLALWQEEGLIPDMAIEPGDKTDEPIRTRGWTHWHHLFAPRNLLLSAFVAKHFNTNTALSFCDILNFNAKLCRWTTSPKSSGKAGGRTGGASDNATDVFSNQALNTLYSYAHRSAYSLIEMMDITFRDRGLINSQCTIKNNESSQLDTSCDLWITDPPYADAVNYHEITEFFIAWLRKNPPKPFDEWVWDSRRALAIKGSGEEFRRGMAAAYSAMAARMPENGMQCVMFTHQDTSVWGDLAGIFWAAGLQVASAWYIATETTSELKKGGYVQGTVILALRKRPPGERAGFKQRLLPAVRHEVQRQIETMMHLNDTVKNRSGEPVWNDADLQMAGYAAALKVLTACTRIGGEDVTTFALRLRRPGEITVVDEIVQQAAETASAILIPEGLSAETWSRLTGIERFMLRMMDMETTGAAKLDNYQNFAKAFRVADYARVMGDMRPNRARLKRATEFASRDLTDSTELGASRLGRLITGVQQILHETEPGAVVEQMRAEMADFLEIRPLLIDLLAFLESTSPGTEVRAAAEVLGARLKNLRFGE